MRRIEIRKKAKQLGVPNAMQLDIITLVRELQTKEGFASCFHTRETCGNSICSWRELCCVPGHKTE